MPNIFENFTATRFAEIDINIWRRNTVRIQKPLENQSVLERIDVGDSKNVGDYRTRRRTTPRPDRNASLLCKMNEVPNNEQITDEPRLFENAQLIIESPDQLGIARRAFTVALPQAVITKLAQKTLARFSRRDRIFRILGAPKFKVQVTTLANFKRVLNRLRKIAKHLVHFLWRFEIQLRDIAHAGFVLHHFASADAKHYVVRLVIAPAQKMHIVCRNQTDAQVSRDLR